MYKETEKYDRKKGNFREAKYLEHRRMMAMMSMSTLFSRSNSTISRFSLSMPMSRAVLVMMMMIAIIAIIAIITIIALLASKIWYHSTVSPSEGVDAVNVD